MDLMKIFDVIGFALGAIKDGKIDEAEIVGLIQRVVMMVASIKGKPMSDAQAHDVSQNLITLYKLFN